MARPVHSSVLVLSPFPLSHTDERGYTLVEVMAVVVIVGILATLATYGVRRYLFSSKTAEAIHMIGGIKSAQEAWRDETFQYLPVSTSMSNVYPQGSEAAVENRKYPWDRPGHTDIANWRRLGLSTNQYVYFGYSCVAGGPGMPNNSPPGAAALGLLDADPFSGLVPTEPWYVVRAVGDLDADGERSAFVSSSFSSEIYSERPEE